MNEVWFFWGALALLSANLLLLLVLLLRRPPVGAEAVARLQQLLVNVQGQTQQTMQRIEHVEGELRREIGENARGGRQEIQQTLATFQETIVRQGAETTRTQNAQIDAFAQQLVQLRGTLGDTIIRSGARIDNQCHISHNVEIGQHAAVIAQSMVGGSAVAGEYSWLAPAAIIMNQAKIGARATVGLGAVVVKDVPAGLTVMGSPAIPADEFRAQRAAVKKLLG